MVTVDSTNDQVARLHALELAEHLAPDEFAVAVAVAGHGGDGGRDEAREADQVANGVLLVAGRRADELPVRRIRRTVAVWKCC